MSGKTHSAEGGTAGVAVSVANSGGGSGDAFDDVVGTAGAGLTYDATHASGTLALQVGATATGVAYAEWTASGAARTGGRVELYLSSYADPAIQFLPLLRIGRGGGARDLLVYTDHLGKLTVNENSAGNLGVLGAGTLPLATWFRIEWDILTSPAGAGSYDVRVYGDRTTTTAAAAVSGARSWGTTDDAAWVRFGLTDATGGVVGYWLDNLAITDTGLPGPAAGGGGGGGDVTITELVAAEIALVAGTADDGVLPGPAVTFAAAAALSLSPGLALEDAATSVEHAPTFVLRTSAALTLTPPTAAATGAAGVMLRAVGGVSVALPTPAIVAGRPTLPAYWARLPSSAAATTGPAHIHAVADPDPVWDPVAGGWAYPPPAAGAGHARWTVRSMPNPDAFGGDYYWVGEPSSDDGTARIATACRAWAPDGSTPDAPAWRSIYPYKPSIRAHVHYGGNGQALTITAGMRFNLHFVEHMWLDWGRSMPQPFTWVVAGAVLDYPSPGYLHTILDAGRDPRSLGVPAYSADQVQTNRRIGEDLGYRSQLAVAVGGLYAGARAGQAIKANFPNSAKARMFFAVFNGPHSVVGNYSPHGKFARAGRIAGGGAHRYYTLGRANGWLGLDHASHLVIFEIRFWHDALTPAELAAQYGQLAATWKFGAYH